MFWDGDLCLLLDTAAARASVGTTPFFTRTAAPPPHRALSPSLPLSYVLCIYTYSLLALCAQSGMRFSLSLSLDRPRLYTYIALYTYSPIPVYISIGILYVYHAHAHMWENVRARAYAVWCHDVR